MIGQRAFGHVAMQGRTAPQGDLVGPDAGSQNQQPKCGWQNKSEVATRRARHSGPLHVKNPGAATRVHQTDRRCTHAAVFRRVGCDPSILGKLHGDSKQILAGPGSDRGEVFCDSLCRTAVPERRDGADAPRAAEGGVDGGDDRFVA